MIVAPSDLEGINGIYAVVPNSKRLGGFIPESSHLFVDVNAKVSAGDLAVCIDSDFAKMAIDEMVKLKMISSADQVSDSHVERVKKAYPAYFDTYEHMEELREYLDTIPNLYCVGRNGQHRYNNIDHSMCTSFEAVKNILSGRADKDNIWSVNTEKEYHEENQSTK
jgi:protoporphyrinogen oxidase